MNMARANIETREHRFSEAERCGVYRAIYERRDVRSSFKPDEIPDEVLARLLDAAHHAPSVGFMQPWGFIVIRDRDVRDKVHEIFDRARLAAAQVYNDDRRALYETLKLASIREAPINLCVTCDEAIVRGTDWDGRRCVRLPYTQLFAPSRTSGWRRERKASASVGSVFLTLTSYARRSAFRESSCQSLYLCLGYVTEFGTQPELEIKGWSNVRHSPA